MKPIVIDEAMNPMSYSKRPTAHQEAIQKEHEEMARCHAVELYLLNDMPELERARFEEHYFECGACADAVEAGQAFISNIRPFEPPVVAKWRDWWRQPAAAIAALLLAVAGGQQYVIAGLMAPHANSVILARQLEKGVAEKAYSVRTPSATIEVSLPAEAGFPFYLVKIAGEKDRRLTQVVPAPAKDSEQRLSVQVSRRALGSGHFTVNIDGLNREDSKTGPDVGEVYEFDLK
jgi:hypothetical protein